MRTKTFVNIGPYKWSGSVYYPDALCFAYNPNSIVVNCLSCNSVILFVNGIKARIALYNGTGDIKLSNIFRSLFKDVATERVVIARVIIAATADSNNADFYTEDGLIAEKYQMFNDTFEVVCGSLAVGDRVDIYGSYTIDPAKPYYNRKVRWFKNYPFLVSALKTGYKQAVLYKENIAGSRYFASEFMFRPKVRGISYSQTSPVVQGPNHAPIRPPQIPVNNGGLSINGVTSEQRAEAFNASVASVFNPTSIIHQGAVADPVGMSYAMNEVLPNNPIDIGNIAGLEMTGGWNHGDDFGIFDDWGDFPNGDNPGTPNHPEGSEPEDDTPEVEVDTPQNADKGVPTSEETFYVIYYPFLNMFVGCHVEDGEETYYSYWDSSMFDLCNYEESYYYNTESGKARTDIEYNFDNKIAYISEDGFMRVKDFGNGRSVGIIDVNPAIAFEGKDAKSFRLLLSWAFYHASQGRRAPQRGEYTEQQTDTVVDIEVCTKKCGYYLRWIDNHGYSQYFLFDKGTLEEKASTSVNKYEYNEYNGLDFEGVRNLISEKETSITCCAMFLDEMLFNEVKTICNANHIDLYLGKDEKGLEMWVPVTLKSASLKHDAKSVLNNVEITFVKPDELAQRL